MIVSTTSFISKICLLQHHIVSFITFIKNTYFLNYYYLHISPIIKIHYLLYSYHIKIIYTSKYTFIYRQDFKYLYISECKRVCFTVTKATFSIYIQIHFRFFNMHMLIYFISLYKNP
jgi:hypothetical protein